MKKGVKNDPLFFKILGQIFPKIFSPFCSNQKIFLGSFEKFFRPFKINFEPFLFFDEYFIV